MSRGVGWLAFVSGVGLAVVGAVTAYLLAGGPWAAAGAVVGAVAGAFAPSVYDGIRESGKRHGDLRSSFEKTPPQSWARLLDPRRELVEFFGRESELADLTAWCEDERAGRLRLVTGPGGVGKTRLSVELAERMKKARWRSERIADGQEGMAIPALRATTSSRALLVVDYSETRVWLRQMLSALASEQGVGVRVLLLARSTGDWWDQLGAAEPAVWDLVQAAKQSELALSAVVDADLTDAEAIAAAVTSFARELGLAERAVEIYGDSGSGQRRVLDLHAAALVAVLQEAGPGLVRVDLRTVLGELLRHEQHFWYESARSFGLSEGQAGITALAQRQIIAAACLLGPPPKRRPADCRRGCPESRPLPRSLAGSVFCIRRTQEIRIGLVPCSPTGLRNCIPYGNWLSSQNSVGYC